MGCCFTANGLNVSNFSANSSFFFVSDNRKNFYSSLFLKVKFFAKFFKAVLLLTVNPIETLIVDSETKRKRVQRMRFIN